MQRQNSNIRQLENTFKIFEFNIPALSAGSTVQYTNADILAAYELSYYSPLYQGAAVYNGKILQTHGYLANSFSSAVGIMNFGVITHNFDRYVALGSQIPYEPQGLSVYDDKLIMNFVNGKFYELTLNLDIPETGYQVSNLSNTDELKAQIEALVTAELTTGYSVCNVELPTDFMLAGSAQEFVAVVTINTPYNKQTVSVSGTIL